MPGREPSPAAPTTGRRWRGVYSEGTGLWIAITANTVLLFAWGAILRHRAMGNAMQCIAAGLTTAMLGLMLVALKALVH